MKRHKPMTRSQKLASAGFKRRPLWKSLPSDDEPAPERMPFASGVDIDKVHFGRYGRNTVHAPQEKREPIRDEAYRRWVASMPCIRCGVPGLSQAAHPNQGRGLGQKADDDLCFPLCSSRPGVVGCHEIHDQLRGMTLEERRQRELDYIATVKAMHEGKIL